MIQRKSGNNDFRKTDSKNCPVCQDLLIHIERFFDMLETTRRQHTSDWLTVDDIAKEMRISKSIVYRLVRNGELEAVNIVETNDKIAQRGHYRIKRSSLNKYIESKRVRQFLNEPISK